MGIKLEIFLNLESLPRAVLELEHFAGLVKYNLVDFLAKNKEKGVLADLYNTAGSKSYEKHDSDIIRSILLDLPAQSTNGVRSFSKNMNGLFSLLSSTNIKYIKCIKPNSNKSPLVFDKCIVLKQLRANGIIQGVKLSKHLYPYMMFIDEFEERYEKLPIVAFPIVKGSTRNFF